MPDLRAMTASALTGTASAFTDARRRPLAIVIASLLVAVLFAFWPTLTNLWHRWGEQEELSHSYFLPVVTAWILWERRKALAGALGAPAISGLGIAAAGLGFLLLGELVHVPMIAQVGFVTLLIGTPLALAGVSLFRLCIIPLAYLLFMVPPPYWVITVLSWKFQLISSELGVAMIRMFGIPVALNGNIIDLPSMQLAVVEACSGLRYLFPFLCLGILTAYFYKGPLWQRAVIVFSTIPITIFMNSFRIAMTGVLIEKVGGNHTDGFLHAFEGWVVFVLCILALFGVIALMTRLRGARNPLKFVGVDDVRPIAPVSTFDAARTVRAGIVLTLMVLAVGIGARLVAARPLVVPERLDFATLPLEFTEWKTREQIIGPLVAETLGADDFIVFDMFGPNDEYVNFYGAWLDARREGKAWHSPLQCLPGGGWEIVDQRVEETARADGTPYFHNRLIITHEDSRYLVYYWYDQRGRKIANEFVMKLTVMWDDLRITRSDGAMVRLMTPIDPGESEADAEARLDRVRLMMEPTLVRYIPA